MSWGSPESPNCSGITVENLQRIDFTQINFAEIIADAQVSVSTNIPNSNEISSQVQNMITDYYGEADE